MDSFFLGVGSSVAAAAVVAGVVSLWNRRSHQSRDATVARAAANRLLRSGLSNFYRNRNDYTRFRRQATLSDYFSTAQDSLLVASYWMAHGTEMESVASQLAKMVVEKPRLRVAVAVVDPDAPYIALLAEYLGLSLAALRARAEWSLASLREARAGLPESERDRLEVRLYATVPSASFIVIDHATPRARIQMDFKPYKTPRSSSITFEFRAGASDGGVFKTLEQAAVQLIGDCPLAHETRTAGV